MVLEPIVQARMWLGTVLHPVVSHQEMHQPGIGLRLVPGLMEVVERLMHFFHRAEGSLHLALRPRRHAPAVLALWHVGANVHPK